MDKIGKREKIILGLMAVVILYAAFDFLTSGRQDPKAALERKTAELNAFTTELTTGIGKDLSKNPGALVLSRAEKGWGQDPFLDDKAYRSWIEAKTPPKETQAAAPKVEIAYTGYLEVGRKRMAIINGVEYREGEALDIPGFVLKTVTPTRIAVENRTTRMVLNIPLQE
ncbi:MAG: hypothetical protein AB1558_09480 [Thermodesulfobacteriota bacterium]